MIILASTSAVRSQLLRNCGIEHEVVASPYDEAAAKARLVAHNPASIASQLAIGKALAVSGLHSGELVIGADQTLAYNNRLVNKCASLPEARHLLQDLRGHTHLLHAAIAVARGSRVLFSHTETVSLKMRDFSNAFLEHYLKRNAKEVLSSVGCYHYEAGGIQLFEEVDGDYHAILGLPLLPLLAFLREIGELDT